MKKTVCELFAGVGGFRCGLNHIDSIDATIEEKWDTVWFSQWEPAEKSTQYAHSCYVYRFGTRLDLNGEDTTNYSIEDVNKELIPDFNLLVGGFPCQDYSVASTLATSKGLEGKKGVLWWSIRETIEKKKPPFILLENVDRLLKSPSKQRGRDFGIILACLRDEGYTVEWRVINAAEYGYQQRRRRIFIFAYRNNTNYYKQIQDFSCENEETKNDRVLDVILSQGFFAKTFPVEVEDIKKLKVKSLDEKIGEVSESFAFGFENSGIMMDGMIYTIKTTPSYEGKVITLGDVMEQGEVDSSYFIPKELLYYTDPSVTGSDETKGKLPIEKRKTWQYIKGSKKIIRTAQSGHEYVYSEGPISMIDPYDKPARTMLTSEGTFSRTTHIVKDKLSGNIRYLTPCEAERIQGFPTNHTKYCLLNGEVMEMPDRKRRFMMGNALVVDLIKDMEKTLSLIFDKEN